MTDPSPNTNEKNPRGPLAWILIPLSFFPLIALLTYDARYFNEWPQVESTNWIGALGDYFAHYGYAIFGLAIWAVPPICVIAAFANARTRERIGHRWRRELWRLTFLTSLACLIQITAAHGGFFAELTEKININDAGGSIGYLLMSCMLAPLLSDFGSSILMTLLLLSSIAGAIGMDTIKNWATTIYKWAMGKNTRPTAQAEESMPPFTTEVPQYSPALKAKEDAKRQREAEKEAARLEKLRIKEEKRLAKEEKRLAKEAPEKTEETEEVPTDKGPYMLPSLSLLGPLQKSKADHSDVAEMSRKLVDTLKLFGVNAELAYTVQGPVVTKYALSLEAGIKPEKLLTLQNTLMMSLKAKSLRIEAPIPGEDKVGIEVPNRAPAGISFREIVESDAWLRAKEKFELPLLFGKDAAGNELIADLATMPHMLVAGATGQGKSVCLNSIINGLLMTRTPEQLKLIMVDPKSVEFNSYVSIPHLIVPIINDNRKVVFSLHWAVAEMEKRLKLFQRARVRNIYDFNHRRQFTQTDMFGDDTEVGSDMPKTVPYVVIIIDEVADLMAAAGKEVTPDIARLTAKARAAGIHLILATQRPDAKIITGTIKANIPGRVAFKTATAIDSRTILDDGGAENLIGRGDMLFKSKDGLLIRAQGAFISDPEIDNITKFIEQHSNTDFDDRFTKKLSTIKEAEVDIYADDETDKADAKAQAEEARAQVKADAAASDFKKAVECVINTHRASTSHFQRQMGWGYNHAAKILDMLEDAGIVAPQSGMGPRQIIMDQDQLLATFNGAEPAEGNSSAEPTENNEGIVEQETFTLEG